MSAVHDQRRDHLATLLKEAEIDVAAFVPGPNFFYLTGLDFALMERPTLLFAAASGELRAIMPELERLKWESEFPDMPTFYWQDETGYGDAFRQAGEALRDMTIGIEGGRMRVFEADALRLHTGPDAVVDAADILSRLRLIKSEDEIGEVKKAVAISQTALAETLDLVSAGMTEKQVSGLLKMRMLANGADGLFFEPIVLAGGHTANPHGVPGETPLRPGDPLLFDFGAQLNGYGADITRTMFVEFAGDRHADIYETVLAANTKGRDIARSGLTAHQLDADVTGVLSASHFADLIVHKTGHGLGLDVHEAPQVMRGNHEPLSAGMLITIEPGLYQPDEIGVRIEDDVLIEASGCRSLTSFPRELTLVGT